MTETLIGANFGANLSTNSSEQLWCIEFDEPVCLDLPEMEQVERIFKGRVVEANLAFAKAYQSTLDQALQWRVSDFLPRECSTSAPFLQDVVRSGYRMEAVETTEQAADGTTKFFVNTCFGTIQDNHVLRAWGMRRDITKTRELEKRLHSLQTAVDSSDDGILVAEVSGKDFPLIYVNRRFTEITGYAMDEVIGRDCRFLQGADTDSVTVKRIRHAINAGEKFRGEILNYRKNGEEFWNFVRLTPVHDQAGNVTHYVGVQTDITERKRYEEMIKQQRQELTHVSRVSTLGEIGATLAHELKQPLASILLNAKAASRMLACDDPNLQELRKIVADIIRDDRRSGRVLDRIYFQMRKSEPAHQPLSINRVIVESLELLEKELIKHRLETRRQLADDLPPVLGDPIELQQVIINLVLNSEQAMQDQTDDRNLSIESSLDDEQHVRLVIDDNGPGLHERDLERVFTAFHTTKTNGLGMGLAINRTIINTHGGRIWAEKNGSRGARFVISLPTAAKKQK